MVNWRSCASSSCSRALSVSRVWGARQAGRQRGSPGQALRPASQGQAPPPTSGNSSSSGSQRRREGSRILEEVIGVWNSEGEGKDKLFFSLVLVT